MNKKTPPDPSKAAQDIINGSGNNFHCKVVTYFRQKGGLQELVYCPANNWTTDLNSTILRGCRDRRQRCHSRKPMHSNCGSGWRPSVPRSKWR